MKLGDDGGNEKERTRGGTACLYALSRWDPLPQRPAAHLERGSCQIWDVHPCLALVCVQVAECGGYSGAVDVVDVAAIPEMVQDHNEQWTQKDIP